MVISMPTMGLCSSRMMNKFWPIHIMELFINGLKRRASFGFLNSLLKVILEK